MLHFITDYYKHIIFILELVVIFEVKLILSQFKVIYFKAYLAAVNKNSNVSFTPYFSHMIKTG